MRKQQTHLRVIYAPIDGHGHEVVGVDEVLDVLVDHARVLTVVKHIKCVPLAVKGSTLLSDGFQAIFDSLHAVHERGQRLQGNKIHL
jgi:hypothetical protein